MYEILAADIGGTSSRFAHFRFDSGVLRMLDSAWFSTAESTSFVELMQRLAEERFSLQPAAANAVVLGVPGPVRAGKYCAPPNISWDIDLDRDSPGGGHVAMVNDFVPQALACRTEAVREALLIQAGDAQPDQPVAVIGAGTGLGHCAVVPYGGDWVPVPSEAGHAAFPFMNAQERELEAYIQEREGMIYCDMEELVSGRGLRWIHGFLTGEVLSPAEVAATFNPDSETLDWFARFYGRAVRHYALTVLALGGVFIAGGVAAKNPQVVTAPSFCEEFCSSPDYEAMLSSIPIRLNTNEDSGLWGAALYGRQMLDQTFEERCL